MKTERKTYIALFAAIMIFAAFLRLWRLGTLPGNGGINQDEAYAGYEAYSLLNYGFDSDGYVNPVYFKAWGSGMNVMESYFMIPFVHVLGLNTLSVRLPMALLSLVTIAVFGVLLHHAMGQGASLAGMLLLSIMPWHLMMSRWGLESNFFPGFLLMAMLFLYKSVKGRGFFVLAMIFYGLSLYTYASAWIVMPFLIGFSVLYLLCTKKIGVDRYFFAGIILLTVTALPLLLFVAVNTGLCGEISTGFMSVPKLSFFRGSEISFKPADIKNNLIALIYMSVRQNDGLIWNTIPQVGLFYYVSAPFILIGIAVSFLRSVKAPKEAVADTLFNIQFLLSLVLGAISAVNANRINIMMIPVVYYCLRGILTVTGFADQKGIRLAKWIVAAVFIAFFVNFACLYTTQYNDKMAEEWGEGLKEALDRAESLVPEKIHVAEPYYSKILFFSEYPADSFAETVKWVDEHEAIRRPEFFGIYDLRGFAEAEACRGEVYLCRTSDEASLRYMNDNGMKVEIFDYYAIGYIE